MVLSFSEVINGPRPLLLSATLNNRVKVQLHSAARVKSLKIFKEMSRPALHPTAVFLWKEVFPKFHQLFTSYDVARPHPGDFILSKSQGEPVLKHPLKNSPSE